MSPWTLFSLVYLSSVVSRSLAVCSWNCRSRMYSMPGSSSIVLTDCTRICSRVISKSFGSVQPFTHDADRDLRSGLAPHALHRVGQLHVLGREAFDLDDAVSRVDAGTVGGGSFDRRDDGQDIVLQRDLDAEAAEAAA